MKALAKVVALLVLAGQVTYVVRSLSRPLWADEIVTALDARLDPHSLWLALLDMADGHPPLGHLLVHGLYRIMGENEVSVRLPEFLAVMVGTAVVYRILRTRVPLEFALLGAALPGTTWIADYAAMGRPYGLWYAFTALSLYLWMETAKPRRGLALVGLALCLAAGMASHWYFLPSAVAAILVGESVRTWRRRRVDLPVVLIVVLVPAIMMGNLYPLLALHAHDKADYPGSIPSVEGILSTYVVLFPGLLMWFSALAVAARRGGAWTLSQDVPELVALVWLLLLPATLWVAAVLVTNAYLPRYCLPSALGAAVLLPMLLARLEPQPGLGTGLLALTFLVQAGRQCVSTVPVQRHALMPPLTQMMVIDDVNAYLENWYYSSNEQRSHMVFVDDVDAHGHPLHEPFVQKMFLGVSKWAGIPLWSRAQYDEYLRQNGHLLLTPMAIPDELGGGLVTYSQSRGWQVTLMAVDAMYAFFRVDTPSGPAHWSR